MKVSICALYLDVTVETVAKAKVTSHSRYKNEITGVEYEIIENIPLTEWFLDNYKKYVSHLEIVTDKSSEGNQFVKGFGGIGGILRYRVDQNFDDLDNEDQFNDDDFI
jgi:peptide chain release factor subunit 1